MIYLVEWMDEQGIERQRTFDADYDYVMGFVERLEKRGIFAMVERIE